MAVQTPATTLDQETADRLSAGFHRCFSDFEADDDLFASDTFFDLLPPMWRFQVEGSGEAFTTRSAPSPRGRSRSTSSAPFRRPPAS